MSVRWLSLAACWAARRSCRSTLFHPPRSSAEAAEFPRQSTHSEISHKGTKLRPQRTQKAEPIFRKNFCAFCERSFMPFVAYLWYYCGMPEALGMVECRGLVAMIEAAD